MIKLYPTIIYIFIIWLVSLLLIAYLGFSTLPHSGKFTNNFWQNFANWDGGHYLGIAQFGYSQKFQYAFFPLYPLTVNMVNKVMNNFLMSAILISLVSTFLGMHLFYRLVSLYFDKKVAQSSILAFLFFPTSFFLLTVYSEGLFFFLAVLTFYLLKQKKLFWATLAATLVSATRLVGMAVVAGVWIEIISTQGLNRKNWFVILAPLGFIIYCVFLYKQTGDPFYFIFAEDHWQRTLVVPGVGFWETLKKVVNPGFIPSNFNIFLDLIFAMFGVGFAIRSFRFLPVSFAVFSLVSVGIPLLTPTLTSVPRFLLVIFPIFILIALIKNQYIKLTIQMVSLMLLAVFTTLFVTGYWVS